MSRDPIDRRPAEDRRPADAGNVRDRLRRALPAAIKARDTAAVAAVRSALAAIDNTEAVDPDAVGPRPVDPGAEADPADGAGSDPGAGAGAVGVAGAGAGAVGVAGAEFAGTVAGVGAGEVARRLLTDAEMEEIVRAEVVERQHSARLYENAGQLDQAERLRREARLLNAHLDDPEPPAT
jgi:uncharacterized protein